MPAPATPPRHRPLLAGLVLTRIIGWGSCYYAPAVMTGYLQRDIGLGLETVFGGITIVLVIGAFLSPAVGRHLDRRGTRRAMIAGTPIVAAGFVAMAFSAGPISYLASWVLLALGHVLTLGGASSVTVTQIVGARARRVLGLMMLATGLSSSVFWPLTAWLCAEYGWRAAFLAFAALQMAVVLPIHAAIPRFGGAPGATEAGAPPIPTAVHGRDRAAFRLLALIFSASGLVSWGLPVHLIGVLEAGGVAHAQAVAIAALTGPATLAARLIDAALGERFPVERVALVGLATGLCVCLLPLLLPLGGGVAALFVIAFSGAMGVVSVARATLPLALFGSRGFGTVLGRLAVPQNLAFAAAPLIFAFLMEQFGMQAVLLVSAGALGVSFTAMAVLVTRVIRR